jgi:hypothetical protein
LFPIAYDFNERYPLYCLFPMTFPQPTAPVEQIDCLQSLYQTRYGVTLTHEQAKELLESVMQFVYLTQIEPMIAPHFGKLSSSQPASSKREKSLQQIPNQILHALPSVRPQEQ